MSSKLTELTESSPSAPPPSVLCGSGVFSRLSSPSMASSGQFDPSQTYDGYRAVEVLDPACSEFLAKGKDCFQQYNPRSSKWDFCFMERNHVIVPGCCLLTSGGIYGVERMGLLGKNSQSLRNLLLMELQDFLNRDVARWTSVGGPIPVGGRAIYSSSEVPISRTNTEGVVNVVKRIRRIDDSPTDPDSEGSDELDGEEFQVVPHSVGHPSSNSSTQPLADTFQSQVIPSTPRSFQPILASIPTTIPPPSPSTSHARPALNPAVRPSPVQKSRNSPIPTSHQLQPMASSRRRRDGLSPLPFPAAQVFQRRECWPIQVTREDTNMASENQEAVARLFRRADRNSREVIMYANDRTIPGTASEEMAAKFAWYEDELISNFQRTFYQLGRDN
ncbi:hypothetical protein O181_102069 [Austropuccinia psidii MF-1]|uniref:Uncharacterized protein n=1 Tax=Austropuccinia psidii MF-1 TaxID=1389203 RepID=A0A9Q3PHX2_9BASI|nr:hypothetical protein [Austropuccinia psidii MF-1]